MRGKVTTINLQVGDIVRAFDAEHAERLLRMRYNGGWRIADGEKVELTENGFRPVKDKRGDSASK